MPAKSGEPSCSIGDDAAVHRLRRRLDPSPLHPADPLQAEADAEQRLLAAADRLGADAEVARSRPGRPGPGEMTTLSNSSRSSSSQLASSLRTTSGSTPFTSASNWKRL